MSEKLTFAEYINIRLRELGYDVVFGVPGYYIMPLWQTFTGKPYLVLARHESGAVYMADGWARITRKPGVVLSTLGPGQTNMFTGIACAYKDSVPLLAITGQANTKTFGKGVFQECYPIDRGFSPTSIFAPITKGSYEITDKQNAVYMFECALKLASSGRQGPVHLSIPLNIQEAELIIDLEADPKCIFNNSIHNVYIHTDKPNNIIDFFIESERVLILAGWGCYLSGQMDELQNLAEKLSAPIITTVKGLAAIKYNFDWFLGHVGPGQPKGIAEFLIRYNPDTILILGSSLSASYFDQIKEIIKKGNCIQVDIDHAQIGLRTKINLGIIADLRFWLPEICKLLPSKTNEELKKQIKEFKTTQIENLSSNTIMVQSIDELNRILPEDTVIVPDAGNHWLDTLSCYKPKCFGGLFTNMGLGAMGYAIGASIGLKLALPNKRIVCVTGDGSALMSGNEISVSGALNLNNIFIIYNNCCLGRVRTFQHFECQNNYVASDLPEIRFDKWAKSMGVDGYRVHSIEEFRAILKTVLKSNKTSVIEIMASNDEIPLCFQ
jgi:acetolactate synthase I/II/III large subunit